MAQFILVYTHPTEGEQRFELIPGRSYRIGSRPDNDIVIDQKDVSRRHAVLRVQDGSFHITDLDSKNGTFINGAKTLAETFSCGDMVHLSSARLVIVEVGTGSYPTSTEAIASRDEDSGARSREDTQKFRSEASMEDVVSLLETTASAVRRGALADPLGWAVDHLGFDGALVLYRDENDSVAMVSSAGDLGQLARKSGVLTKLATEHRLTSAAGTRVRQVNELGEHLLVATVGSDHVLVVRYAGQPPAIGDLRSVIASVNAVLASGRMKGKGGATASYRAIDAEHHARTPMAKIAGLTGSVLSCKLAIEQAARDSGPVTVVGERGSGCSLAARAVHDLSVRASAPFVVVDLEGLDPDAIENRLLVDGEALAAADNAEGGTLVLDRVSDMSAEIWETTLGVLADRSAAVPRLVLILNPEGGSELDQHGATLRGKRVSVPSLRDRLDDLPILISVFTVDNGGLGAGRPISFSRPALDVLGGYRWPGNIAELRCEVGRAVTAAHPGHVVEVEHLSDTVRNPRGGDAVAALDLEVLAGSKLAEARNEFETWLVRRALDASGGRQTKAAERLGLSRAGLFKKMKKLGL
jgi:transcriptional regulator with AAA-type ATPase domain